MHLGTVVAPPVWLGAIAAPRQEERSAASRRGPSSELLAMTTTLLKLLNRPFRIEILVWYGLTFVLAGLVVWDTRTLARPHYAELNAHDPLSVAL